VKALLLLLVLYAPVVAAYPIVEISDDGGFFRLYNPDPFPWLCFLYDPIFGVEQKMVGPGRLTDWRPVKFIHQWECTS